MNFVNKLLSRIFTVLTFFLVFLQTYISYNYDSKDVMVLVVSIIFMSLAVINLGYQLFLFVKFRKSYETKFIGNDISINTCVSGFALVLSIISFVLTYVAYLYLI